MESQEQSEMTVLMLLKCLRKLIKIYKQLEVNVDFGSFCKALSGDVFQKTLTRNRCMLWKALFKTYGTVLSYDGLDKEKHNSNVHLLSLSDWIRHEVCEKAIRYVIIIGILYVYGFYSY